MGKMREALDNWRNKSPNQRYGTMNTIAFEAGYQAAIADVKAGGIVAWMLHDGEIWNTPVCPYKDEHGVGLYKLPEDV